VSAQPYSHQPGVSNGRSVYNIHVDVQHVSHNQHLQMVSVQVGWQG
jgi:hypothetical protein